MAEGRYQKDSDAANAAVPRGGLGQRARFRRDTPKKKISPATRFLLAGDQAIRAGRCPSAFDSYSRAIALQSSLRAAVYRRLGRCRASLDRSKRFRRLATLMALEGRRAIASRKAAARRRAAKRAHKKAKAKPAAVDAYQAK